MAKKKKEIAGKFLQDKVPKVVNFRPTYAYKYGDVFGFDLADYSKEKKGYIVLVIDYATRYIFTRVVPNKNISTIEGSLESIFEQAFAHKAEDERKPKSIHSDREQGLISPQNKYHDLVYHTDSLFAEGSAPIVERAIRTIRTNLETERQLKKGRKWDATDVEIITNEYNRTKHRTLKMKPIDALKAPEKIYDIQHEIATRKDKPFPNRPDYRATKKMHEGKDKLKVGDKVLAKRSTYSDFFRKGFKRKYEVIPRTIMEIQKGNPTVYILDDVAEDGKPKKYYVEQLKRITDKQLQDIEPLIAKELKKKDKKKLSNAIPYQKPTDPRVENRPETRQQLAKEEKKKKEATAPDEPDDIASRIKRRRRTS